MIRKVHTDNAPAAIGPYSQAVVAGELIFTSGQIALNPETGLLEGETVTAITARILPSVAMLLPCARY